LIALFEKGNERMKVKNNGRGVFHEPTHRTYP